MAQDKDDAQDKENPKEETQEKGEQVEQTEGKKSPVKLIIIAAVAAVLLSGLAVTTTLLFLGGDDSPEATQTAQNNEAEKETTKTAENEEGEEGEQAAAGSPQFFPIRPAFVVNIPSKGRIRFLQIQVDIMSRDDDVIEEVETFAPLIKNELVTLFSNQTYEGVISPEGKERLRKEALARVQKVMQEQAGVTGIEQILFTSFVTQ